VYVSVNAETMTDIYTQIGLKAPQASPTLTGQVSFDDGSAAAPALTNTGDTDTGVYFSAADTLAIATGGVNRFQAGPSGQLGIGNTSEQSSPVQVGVASNWSQVKCGRYFSLGLTTGGTLWAWGQNTYGRLGLGNSTNRSVPVQVGSLSNWSGISGRNHHSIFLNTSGNLFGAGLNSYGRITAAFGNVSSPVQVGTGANWSSVFPSRIISSYSVHESVLAIELVNP
jgi:alpha-tubulin suppressor-like RCC1 family protein